MVEEDYRVNSDSQLTSIRRSNRANTEYVHDKYGNVISKTTIDGKEEYKYNEENQLVEIQSGGKTIEYKYDGFALLLLLILVSCESEFTL